MAKLATGSACLHQTEKKLPCRSQQVVAVLVAKAYIDPVSLLLL
jgi:hypothetical protein